MPSTAEPIIQLRGATKRFLSGRGDVHVAVSDLDLSIQPGEFIAVVGPTGCGKSTTLSLVSGLEPASDGSVRVAGREVTGIPDRIGYMFQADALMPWRTVLGNVAAGLKWRGDGAEATAKALDWVARVGLKGFENYYPHQLSGGMRKRVALAQVLVTEPHILLMDEPFSALDVQTRSLMQDELLRLWQGSGTAVVFVTHDLEEAITLADRVVVMTASPARIKDIFPIPLARPRQVEELRVQPDFIELYKHIWSCLSDEVAIAREEAARVG
ncbi:ABC transporter ATP-binding protein [Microlunatus elymi]|uniref:ABC transporter ATP-binding protein n=1 Tax=Microlunatus elymi TaxID=2596828 RepID=A0A516Q0H6_9ACTN|nr:ABC transporter ATP-binding protein [Microlunatus elymi]QDP96946.1 ABC transporter ATP-binding protein [Microlunatus elymi]